MKVRDLRVLVTGAASGAGRTIVEKLANAGAKVFVSDISEVAVADVSNARPDILVIQTDVSNEAQIDDMFTRAEKHLGGLDVLINNAGIAGPTMAAESISVSGLMQSRAPPARRSSDLPSRLGLGFSSCCSGPGTNSRASEIFAMPAT